MPGQSTNQITSRHYAAFISYRHMSPDQEIAPILQRMLEHNHVRPNRRSPRRIYPVFLDTSELPTLENLDDGICRALENSDCLIVICSPNLPLSKYCLREIEYFKQLHGGRLSRIYTLLVDGTAQESFPESLRHEVRAVQDDQGSLKEEIVDYEPLFSNVVAPTLRESIKKLKKTEFLRIAAAIYGCSYDDLYKRQQRWRRRNILSACALILVLALCFAFYVHLRNRQYNTAKAETYAAYTEACLAEGDELLGLTLGLVGWDAASETNSNRLMKALRSAVVQLDYRREGLPVAPVGNICTMGADIQIGYLSDQNTQAILYADNTVQISDLKTGAVCRSFPTDTISVSPKDLSRYITIQATADESGQLHDTLSIWSTRDNALIKSIPFRVSDRQNPRYKIVGVLGSDEVVAITDHNETIAQIDRDGSLLTQHDALVRILDTMEPVKRDDIPFSVTNGNRMRREPPGVINAAGELMLALNAPNLMTAFSPDWRLFGCLENDTLTIYETGQWTPVGSVALPEKDLRSLYLLRDTHYALALSLPSDRYVTTVVDWRTGQVLLEREGYSLIGDAGHSFYCMDGQSLIRYDFHDMDTEHAADVVAQWGDLCLAAGEGSASLLDAAKGSVLLSADTKPNDGLLWAADLSKILIRREDKLECYDATGALLWDCPAQSAAAALSEDGSVAAWLDRGNTVQVVRADDRSPLYAVEIAPPAGLTASPDIEASERGVCVVDGDGAVWYPADGGDPIPIGEFDSAHLYGDGLLALECSWSYVMDFELWDTAAHASVWKPEDNTGLYAYSPRSGYLVRQVEISGNHPTGEIEVLRAAGHTFSRQSVIALHGSYLTHCALDSTGEYLSVTVDGKTLVYRLKDALPILEVADCPVRYESDAFWGLTACAGKVFHAPMMQGQDLRSAALEPITSEIGRRQLTMQEKNRYPFSG